MGKYLVSLTIDVEVEANDKMHAEVVALEQLDMPGMNVMNVQSIEECCQQNELF